MKGDCRNDDKQKLQKVSLKGEQSKIFDDWGYPLVVDERGFKGRNGFRSDGVIDEESWNAQSSKILFILKEPHGGSGSLAYFLGHIREYVERGELRNGKRLVGPDSKMTTWSNISCWLKGLQDVAMQPEKHLDCAKALRWRDYERQGKARHVADNIKQTVILNLKKEPGGARSNDRQIEEAFARNAVLFKRQYDLYGADIVVCCGRVAARCVRNYGVIDDYSENYADYFETPVGRLWYYAPPAGPVVIGFYHPQCSKKHHALFRSLVQTAGKALDDACMRRCQNP